MEYYGTKIATTIVIIDGRSHFIDSKFGLSRPDSFGSVHGTPAAYFLSPKDTIGERMIIVFVEAIVTKEGRRVF